MRIIAFGDIHMDYKCIEEIPNIEDADLVIITGDLTNYGGVGEAELVLKTVEQLNRNILAIHGNLDLPSVANYLMKKGISLHKTGKIIDNVGFMGVGGSNPTPFDTPSEYSEEELRQIVTTAYSFVKDAPVKILISHTPPLDTKADLISGGIHVGSSSIREFIERHKPAFCITGHIHEARSIDKIGNTVIINPGMLRNRAYIVLESNDNNEWSGDIKDF